MEVIVLAGGLGTRLASVVSDVPKPMAPVAGRPFLLYILDDLIDQGATRIVLAVCHMREVIMEAVGDSYRGVPVVYSIETTPLGTGGGIRRALELCREDRVNVVNGDSYFQVDLQKFQAVTVEHGWNLAIAVKEMKDYSRYGQVVVDADGFVTAFLEKQHCDAGYINGGIYCLNRTMLTAYPEAFSMERDCFPELVRQKEIGAVPFSGYFIDIGIPEDYEKAQSYFGGASL